MPNSKTNPSPLEHILAEQCAARDYILGGGPDPRAWDWLHDWIAEELLFGDEVLNTVNDKPLSTEQHAGGNG